MRTNRQRRSFAVALAFVLMLATLAGIGCARYDGIDGLWRRVRLQFSASRPHPEFVPTPLHPAALTTIPSLTGPDGTETLVSPSPSADFTPVSARTDPTLTPPTPGLPGETLEPATMPSPTRTPTTGVTESMSAGTGSPYAPEATSASLRGLKHWWQTWNNCGPATLAMYLSFYGSPLDQAQVGQALRHYDDDKNVNTDELAAFAQSQGFEALVRVNGSARILRLLSSNDVPVLIETWLEEEADNGMGHYRLISGYDDSTAGWIVYDSYVSKGVARNAPYAGIRIDYAELDADWAVFNRGYMVVFRPEQTALVEAILGDDLDDRQMWLRALSDTETELAAHHKDVFTWFNLGTNLTALSRFDEAASAYDQARQLGLPWRMLWYQFGPFKAYYETGRYDEVLALVDATLHTAGDIEELYYWRGQALRATGDEQGACNAWKKALDLNPGYRPASAALAETE